jgi:hypothetical protein
MAPGVTPSETMSAPRDVFQARPVEAQAHAVGLAADDEFRRR